MAAEKKRIVKIEDLFARTKVRYNRANLTVDQWVSVHLTSIEGALKAHREGKASAEDVAWAFVKEQVTAHTPSFKWADADLDKLFPRIIAVMEEPKLKARSPAELIPELEAIEKNERERWKKVSKQIQKTIAPKMTKEFPAIREALKANQALRNISGLENAQRMSKAIGMNQGIAKSLQPRTAEIVKAIQPNLKAFEGVSKNWEAMSKAVLSQAKLSPIDIDMEAYKNLLSGPVLKDEAIRIQSFDRWRELARQVGDAAREANYSDLAGAVEATANEAAASSGDIDLEPILERLEAMSEELEKLNLKNSMDRALFVTIIGGAILRFIEIMIFLQYGLPE